MFVTGSAGLTTFDISDPASPEPLGALPLPHFENEDVDLGGNILLISNDAAESTGILYVIDISDPATPGSCRRCRWAGTRSSEARATPPAASWAAGSRGSPTEERSG
jgi:hypothetical protein